MCDDSRVLAALQALLVPVESLAKRYDGLQRDVDDLRVMLTEVEADLRLVWFLQQMTWLHPAARLIRVGLDPHTFTPTPIPPKRSTKATGVAIPTLE